MSRSCCGLKIARSVRPPLPSDYVTDFFVLQGDVNGDGVINNTDMAAVNAVLGSRPGSSNWDPNADLNRDGRVTTSDRIILYDNLGHAITPPAGPAGQVTPAAAASLPAWSFDGSTQLTTTNDLSDGSPVGGITFSADADTHVLEGNALDLSGDITNRSPNTQTINLRLTLIGGSRVLNTASGDLTIAGNIGESGGGFGITKVGSGVSGSVRREHLQRRHNGHGRRAGGPECCGDRERVAAGHRSRRVGRAGQRPERAAGNWSE